MTEAVDTGAVDWLALRALGFGELRGDERGAITDFSLLWSFFEGTVLDGNARPESIRRVTEGWADAGLLESNGFATAFAYFQNRYCIENGSTYRFYQLYLERSGRAQKEFVEKVLTGEENANSAIARACLLIVCRFRNNLFHGEKWSYELRGQLDNFR